MIVLGSFISYLDPDETSQLKAEIYRVLPHAMAAHQSRDLVTFRQSAFDGTSRTAGSWLGRVRVMSRDGLCCTLYAVICKVRRPNNCFRLRVLPEILLAEMQIPRYLLDDWYMPFAR